MQDLKTCYKCGEVKPLSKYQGSRTKESAIKYSSHCKECVSTYHKAYYAENRARIVNRSADWYKDHRERALKYYSDKKRALKTRVLEIYGGACQCCGESAYEFLVLDHIRGLEGKPRPVDTVKWAYKNGCPDSLRALCQNCNFSLGAYGYCAHKPLMVAPTPSKFVLYSRRKRQIVLDAYGGKCDCCGESAPEFLAVDHRHGGGNKHRRELGKGAKKGSCSYYNWIIKNGFPDFLRILCHNCNQANGSHGTCPHTKTERASLISDEEERG